MNKHKKSNKVGKQYAPNEGIIKKKLWRKPLMKWKISNFPNKELNKKQPKECLTNLRVEERNSESTLPKRYKV